MKSNDAKRVNRRIRQLNKQLKEDVFGNRFELRQVKKAFGDGIELFLYEMRDNLQPERNCYCSQWYSAFDICKFNNIDIDINNFIVKSDFWKTYNK